MLELTNISDVPDVLEPKTEEETNLLKIGVTLRKIRLCRVYMKTEPATDSIKETDLMKTDCRSELTRQEK